MAGRTIKGITLEIGGNTTNLGKALKVVDDYAKSLTSNLKSVNKALELDPTNTDLLVQKQRLLSEAINNTSERLELLKQAQKEAAKSVGNYDAWKEAYAPIQEQIDATKKKLTQLLNEQKKLEKAGKVDTDAYRQLAEEIDSLESDLKNLRAQGKAVSDEFGNPISTEEYEKLQREIVFTEDKLKKLTESADKAQNGFDETGDEAKKASKGVEKFADAAGIAEDAGRSMGETLADAAKKGFSAVGAAAGAVLTGVTAAADSTRDYRTEIGKLNAAYEASGHNATAAEYAYKKMVGVLGETDQSVEAAQQIALLANSFATVVRWSNQVIGIVGTFGDALQPETFYESANETLKLGEATGAYVQMLEGCGLNVEEFNEGLASCTTEAEKQAYMLIQTERALAAAGDAYKRNNSEIIRANEVSEEWMSKMAEIGTVTEPVITDIKEIGLDLAEFVIPYVADAAEWVGTLSEKFQALPEEQKKNIVTFTLLAGAVALLTNPVGLVIGAITGLIAIFVNAYNECEWFREGIDILFSGLADIILNWQQNLEETWGNVQNGLEMLGDGFEKTGQDISTSWNNAMEASSNTVKEHLSDIEAAYVEHGGGIEGIIAASIETIEMLYDTGWTFVDELTGGKLTSIADFVEEKMDAARETVSDAIDTIKNKFDFEWDWPDLKLPHFSVSGKFSLNPPSIPDFNVSWYADGGILNGAQIFGSMGKTLLGGGEAGPEAVLPLASFYDNLRDILIQLTDSRAASGTVVQINIEHFENNRDQDLDEIAEYVEDRLQFKAEQEAAVYG